ncbi:MAG TPA: 50S ribosomal protein L29 [Candidatus Paceibacterota bacterium]
MKKSEFKKLQSKSVAELGKELFDSREKLRNLKFDLKSGKVKETAVLREIKKRIAKILTVAREKTKEEIVR